MKQPPPLYGLVLAGGHSRRMGEDKSRISYHGLPQRDYLFGLLQTVCESIYYSIRPDQQAEFAATAPLLLDSEPDLGPFAGLEAAFDHAPQAAWLIVACDLPLVDAAGLRYLIEHRKPEAVATAFLNADNNIPEPLLAIWEPACLPILKHYRAIGNLSPRHLLRTQNTHLILAPDPAILKNVNHPADRATIFQYLGRKPT